MMNVFEKIRENLEELCEQTYYNSVNGNRDEGIRNNAYHNAIEVINQVEQEHNNGWIACSERLPEESYERYLVTTRKVVLGVFLDITTISYLSELPDGNKSWEVEEEDVFLKVIAWQPLPQPYKERDTNGN